jgi:hypothetical protein
MLFGGGLDATLQNAPKTAPKNKEEDRMLAAPVRGLIALVLVALALLSGACGRLQGLRSPAPEADLPLAVTAPAGNLQEVPPPAAVQQLRERLDQHNPQLRVLAPADNTLLPAGPWTLRLELQDWPIANAPDLGLGPHVVVQLDDNAPLRLGDAEALAAIPMAELRPGSHRLTIYAARPWGEAVKSPGASTQIRVHRVAANPSELPAPGSPQLIATSPEGQTGAEPVLLDWLLFDAPLQHLRDDDGRWRLRLTVNGDSFLVDQQTPLWVKGFKPGSNAVQMELLDGRGDPLNPPFNSLVKEVVINSSQRPAWQRSSLKSSELALLSGEALPPPPVTEEPSSEPIPEEAPEVSPLPAEPPQPAIPAAPLAAVPPEEPQTSQPEPEPMLEMETDSEPDLAAQELEPPAAEPPAAPEPLPVAEPLQLTPAEDRPAATTPTNSERIAPSSSLGGSAREQVNADGSLLQPKPSGPLARLQERFSR